MIFSRDAPRPAVFSKYQKQLFTPDPNIHVDLQDERVYGVALLSPTPQILFFFTHFSSALPFHTSVCHLLFSRFVLNYFPPTYSLSFYPSSFFSLLSVPSLSSTHSFSFFLLYYFPLLMHIIFIFIPLVFFLPSSSCSAAPHLSCAAYSGNKHLLTYAEPARGSNSCCGAKAGRLLTQRKWPVMLTGCCTAADREACQTTRVCLFPSCECQRGPARADQSSSKTSLKDFKLVGL